ncbi:hypothetical protein [Terasakiella sp. SH-1]|uniref:hypothetical protein n=1 Tax=Terasakiella sp. SH-1 TaxID=2560057 RepID=UPI001F0FF6BA|nr:hypothetical protein [Terasakiella sp. SH-1]
MIETVAFQGCFDGIGDNGFTTKIFDVFARDTFAPATGWNDTDINDSTYLLRDTETG